MKKPLMYPILALALLFAACAKPELALPEGEVAFPAPPSPLASVMLTEVNALRQAGCRCGNRQMPPVPPLKWNAQLAQAAQGHASDMQRNSFFDHQGSDGSTIGSRAKAAGYQWRGIAENIAWGYPDVPAVVRGWRESPGHCQNMMSKDYDEMGGANAGAYWVQTLGRK